MKTLFYNSDVIKITGLSQRQIVNWAEKGLVVPISDAHGAGSKREYSYTNLLEFGLCKTLFNMGLSLHMVKEMLKALKNAKALFLWAEHEKEFFQTHAEKIKKDFEDGNFDEEIYRDIAGNTDLGDPDNFSDVNKIQRWLKPKTNMLDIMSILRGKNEGKDAVLSFYLKDGEMVPHYFPYGIERFMNQGKLDMERYCRLGIFIVNLGRIRKVIDHRISKEFGMPPLPGTALLFDDNL